MLNNQGLLDLIFQALADGSRRSILERLTRGPASVSELAQPLEMSLPAVVQHLQVLEASGLISTEKIGRVRICTLEAPGLRAAQDWMYTAQKKGASHDGTKSHAFDVRAGAQLPGSAP